MQEQIVNKFDMLGILPHTLPNAIGLWPNEQLCLVWSALQCDFNKCWVEIGSFCGGSTILLGMAKKNSKCPVIAIDKAFNPMFDYNIKRSKLKNIQKVQHDSLEFLKTFDNEISFAFIDGWHSFSNIVKEFELLLPNLTEKAIIGFHDVSPKMWNNSDQIHFQKCLEYAKTNFDQLITSTQQDFRIDEAIAYICNEYNYNIIDIPVRKPLAYHKETGLSGWVRGTTSPHNAYTIISRS